MGGALKRIGFVDYNLDNFHANVYLKLLRNDLKDRGFTVAGGTGMLEKESRAWAAQNDVPYFQDVKDLDGAVDHYVILAPSNPETHMDLCEQVFPRGKSTYVDKTFAPDLRTARRIFSLADRHGVAMQTTSALRYTEAQDHVRSVGADKVLHAVTWGGGSSFGEYAIHPLEMIVSCMGAGVERVMCRGTEDHRQLLLDFAGGRTGVVNVYTRTRTPYAAALTTTDGTRYFPVDTGRIFLNTAVAALDLFESGRPAIPREETLAIRRVLDLAGKAGTKKGFVKL